MDKPEDGCDLMHDQFQNVHIAIDPGNLQVHFHLVLQSVEPEPYLMNEILF